MKTISILGKLAGGAVPESLRARLPYLAGEAAVLGLVSNAIAFALGLELAGVVAVFLCSAALLNRFDELLEENRRRIYESTMPSGAANRLTVFSVVAIFVGVLTASVVIAVASGTDPEAIGKGLPLVHARLLDDTIFSPRFQDFLGIAANNLAVVACAGVLAFIYRAYGVLLVLCWNAALWGSVLTVLVARSTEQSHLPAPLFVAGASAALLPHLILEGAAYVIAGLAALYASKASFYYTRTDPRFRAVMRSALHMVLVALILVIVGAVVESTYAPLVIRQLAPPQPMTPSGGL
ncbi:MAG: stage II sporulation protein M [Candidatus Schekmanbacteria bacterium]|nr:stage II sporulation protein M [Candidatus Schekmanbacteria bacterium]